MQTCEGSCEQHKGTVRFYQVNYSNTTFRFYYCDNAVHQDRLNGFDVRELVWGHAYSEDSEQWSIVKTKKEALESKDPYIAQFRQAQLDYPFLADDIYESLLESEELIGADDDYIDANQEDLDDLNQRIRKTIINWMHDRELRVTYYNLIEGTVEYVE